MQNLKLKDQFSISGGNQPPERPPSPTYPDDPGPSPRPSDPPPPTSPPPPPQPPNIVDPEPPDTTWEIKVGCAQTFFY